MARKSMSAAQKKAVSVRMKAYWAKRRKAAPHRKVHKATPVPPTHAMSVRVLSQQDGLTRDVYEIDTWGELVDILTTKYPGIHIYEVYVNVR